MNTYIKLIRMDTKDEIDESIKSMQYPSTLEFYERTDVVDLHGWYVEASKKVGEGYETVELREDELPSTLITELVGPILVIVDDWTYEESAIALVTIDKKFAFITLEAWEGLF